MLHYDKKDMSRGLTRHHRIRNSTAWEYGCILHFNQKPTDSKVTLPVSIFSEVK